MAEEVVAGVKPGVSVGAEAVVGFEVDGMLKVTTGLWLLISVMVNEVVVSCITKVTAPVF